MTSTSVCGESCKVYSDNTPAEVGLKALVGLTSLMTDPLGSVWHYAYDAVGNTYDDRGNPAHCGYVGNNNNTCIDAYGCYIYNAADQSLATLLTHRSTTDAESVFVYDALNRLGDFLNCPNIDVCNVDDEMGYVPILPRANTTLKKEMSMATTLTYSEPKGRHYPRIDKITFYDVCNDIRESLPRLDKEPNNVKKTITLLGEKIRLYRLRRGVSRKEFCLAADVNPIVLAAVENGYLVPEKMDDVVTRIDSFYGTKFSDFLADR